jgi:hypothetical protein
MDFNWTQTLEELGPDAAFRLINEARPPASYLYNQFLPEMPSSSYHVEDGSMTIRPTMAGLAGMDSPYPPGGAIDISTFMKESAKIAQSIELTEKMQRTIQEVWMRLLARGGDVAGFMRGEAMAFMDRIVTQAQLDTAEWLRGQALATGAIAWTFNKKELEVDYGVPTANKLTSRTGNDGYGGSASKFWTDVLAARRLLRYSVRAFIAHPLMIDAIINQSANTINVLAQGEGFITIQKYRGDLERPSTDARETLTLISYGLEAEVFDLSNPGQTTLVPFHPTTKIVAVGNNTGTRYVVGAGANAPVDYPLGYTHLAPTVEGSGREGRWSRLFTPEGRPWALRAESVSNLLPCISSPDKVVIMTSELPA